MLSLRTESLEVIATLKASQVVQTLQSMYYQTYFVSTRDQISLALTQYRAGNTTTENWSLVSTFFNSTFGTSQAIIAVSIFDISGTLAYNVSVDPSKVFDTHLFPASNRTQFIQQHKTTDLVLAGPLLNPSDESYLMSITLPVLSNGTLFVGSETQSGFVTIVFTTDQYRSIINDTTGLNDNGAMYLVSTTNSTSASGRRDVTLLFPRTNDITNYTPTVSINEVMTVNLALDTRQPGSSINAQLFGPSPVAVGYAYINALGNDWVVLITDPHSFVFAPITKLRNITVISGSTVMVVCTLVIVFCVHFGVQPIYRLTHAAEQTTLSFHSDDPKPSEKSRDRPLKSRLSFWKSEKNAASMLSQSLTPSPSNTEQKSISPGTVVEPAEDIEAVSGSHPTIAGPISPMGDKHRTNTELSSARRILVPVRVKIREFKYVTDELVSLQYSFNRMADELDKQYTQLEDMVFERTKELEAAMVQAEKANEAKSLFIANITHELRTPLNGILGLTAVSLTERDQTKVKRSLRLISKSGMLLLSLLNDLLTFSKNQIGHVAIEENEFVVEEILAQLQEIYKSCNNDKRIVFEYDVAPVLPHMVLFGDSGRILHVLLNLMSNCVKFAPEESKVTVRIKCTHIDAQSTAELQGVFETPSDISVPSAASSLAYSIRRHLSNSSGSHPISTSVSSATGSKSSVLFFAEPRPCTLRFEVEDQGPGIDLAQADSLFEPFVQGDQALSRKHGGAGLGLSICKQLVDVMGGIIELRNVTCGSGLVVIVDLPLKQTRRISDSSRYSADRRRTSTPSSSFSAGSGPPPRALNDLKPQPPAPTSAAAGYFSLRPKPHSRATDTTLTMHHHHHHHHRSTSNHPASPSTITLGTPSSPSDAATTTTAPRKPHILVAEDNIINQEIMKRMLALEGLRDVDLALNGDQAVAKTSHALALHKPYDIIFMDVQMPFLDGLAATRVLRDEVGFKGPVVALTAFADERERCREAGMDGYLEKPVMRDALRKVLDEYCGAEALLDVVGKEGGGFESALRDGPATPT